MQMKTPRKAISLFVIAVLLLSILPGSWAANAVDEDAVHTSETTLSLEGSAQESTETISPLGVDTVPEIIGYEKALNRNHVLRLYSDEGDDLNKIVFLNADGTKTMYLYDFPVKYVDTNGNVRDISLDIANTAAGFQTASGAAVTTFATNISDGIRLSGNGVDISLVPLVPSASGNLSMSSSASSIAGGTISRTATRIDSQTIAYPFDAKTTIEYSLTYTGFKEDIVVSEYTGQTEYSFRLYTDGCALREINGTFCLVDDAGNIKATIGDIIIFTADERNNTFGQLVPATIVENEQYLLTIVVDADFLADEKTVYPIRIDPTIEIFYAEEYEGDIEDITVSSTTTYSGTSGSLYIGKKEGAGICRMLMKFPGLSDLGSNVIIQDATLKMRDLLCESTAMDIYCYLFDGNDWTDSTATWTNTDAGNVLSLGPQLDMVTMDYDIGVTYTAKHWYSFDIKDAVQAWCDETYSLNAGLLFKMSYAHEDGSTYTFRTVGSFNRSSNQPFLEVTYIVEGDSFEVVEGGTVTLSTSGIGATITSWTSSNTGIATVNSSGVVTGVLAGDATITAFSGTEAQKVFTIRVVPPNRVYWSGAGNETNALRTLTTGQTKTLSSMGLSPIAVNNGYYSYGFNWTSGNTAVATVNANGDITAVGPGNTVITGTSRTFGSSIGQLTLIVFVVDQMMDITLIALKDDPINHTGSFTMIKEDFCAAIGYEDIRTYGVEDTEERINPDRFSAYMATSKILYFRGHGARLSIIIDNDGTQISRYYASYVNTLPVDAFQYCDLVIYAACLTGQGKTGADNLVNATVSRGAKTVVGFMTKVNSNELYEWESLFFTHLSGHNSVISACNYASKEIQKNTAYRHQCKFCTENCDIYCEDHCIDSCNGFATGNVYCAGDQSKTFS